MTTTFLPLFVYERHRASLEVAAFRATFYTQLSAVLVMPLFGALSDYYAFRRVRNRFTICAIVSIIGAPAVLAIGLGTSGAMLIAGLLLLGVPTAATDASRMPMLCNVAHPRQRATAYGMLNMASCLTGGVAAFLAAVTMRSLGLSSVIASLGVLFVALCVLLLITGHVLLSRDMPAQREK